MLIFFPWVISSRLCLNKLKMERLLALGEDAFCLAVLPVGQEIIQFNRGDLLSMPARMPPAGARRSRSFRQRLARRWQAGWGCRATAISFLHALDKERIHLGIGCLEIAIANPLITLKCFLLLLELLVWFSAQVRQHFVGEIERAVQEDKSRGYRSRNVSLPTLADIHR